MAEYQTDRYVIRLAFAEALSAVYAVMKTQVQKDRIKKIAMNLNLGFDATLDPVFYPIPEDDKISIR